MFMSTLYSIALLTFPFYSFFCHAANIPRPDGTLANPPPTSQISGTRPLEDIQISCRGLEYGFDLDYSSCQDAFSTFKEQTSLLPMRIGIRGTGPYSQVLPWKWVS
ncbi:MAG: hypothetical protein Q9168_007672, partial [Polycauliona sp. 1 TL-2023]